MYAPVDKFPHFPSLERRVLDLWAETRAFDRLREHNRGGRKWSFLDGPITANNPMGVHHAWGRTLKDMYQRYHAMSGAGAALPERLRLPGAVGRGRGREGAAASSPSATSRRYGVARFVEDCKERVRKFSGIQTEQSIRLGYWMDWDNSYFTMSDENNYTIWRFLKKCHERGFVYRGSTDAVVPALRRRPLARWRCTRATSGSRTCRCSCASRCAAGTTRPCWSGPPRPGR